MSNANRAKLAEFGWPSAEVVLGLNLETLRAMQWAEKYFARRARLATYSRRRRSLRRGRYV